MDEKREKFGIRNRNGINWYCNGTPLSEPQN